MNELNSEKIELINAHGPYNHSTWAYEGLKITNEERLSGRVELLAKKIRECILKNFAMDEIKSMSIVDVGCYDGWILNELSDLPFSEIVGIEPRENNISKAKSIRELLNIKSKIRFEIGDVDSIGKEKFDVVICTGVLHHLDSISSAVHKLRSICNKMLFLETACISSKHITRSFKKEIEMKDVAYFNRPKICGITGQKFESSYYDGSADKLRVVNFPSIESLLMYFEIEGLSNIQIAIDPKSYDPILKKQGWLFKMVAISALVGSTENVLISNEYAQIESYELGLMKTVLDRKYIEALYNWAHLHKFELWSPLLLNTFLYIRSPKWASGLFLRIHKAWFKDRYVLEIVKNLKFSPDDKLCLEYGKILYKEKDYQGAISILKDITRKLNADWRSVYRSFYLLYRIYRDIGLQEESERYEKLCLTCNSKFPIGFKMD